MSLFFPRIDKSAEAVHLTASVRSQRVDHTPMYTEPDLVIDVISEAARETLS